MIWTKPLVFYLMSSRVPLSEPITSECVPFHNICYDRFPDAGVHMRSSRRKRSPYGMIEKSATIDVDQLITKELSVFEKLMYPFTGKPKELLSGFKIYLYGILKRVVEAESKAKQAESEVKQLVYDNGVLSNKMEIVKEKLQNIEIPSQIKVTIDDTEARFEGPSRCEKCLQFGHKTSDCPNPKAQKSQDPKRNRILNRKRFWMWILENQANDKRISMLLKELKESHEKEPEKTTFELYKEKFCEAVGKMHEIVNSKIHVFDMANKIKSANIFDPEIDRFIKPIIRALADLPIEGKPAVEYYEE